ncbi:MAG TPA: hypothetical protein VGM03_21060 [Phycisphaerae bacterium]|jgi:hypothetical protein
MSRAEAAYVRDMKRRSAFDMLETGEARILTPDEYPEPIKRFLARRCNILHLRLPGRVIARSNRAANAQAFRWSVWHEAGLSKG